MRRRKLRWRRRRIRHHHRRCWRHCTRHRATCGGAASATARTARTVSARTRSNACIIIYMRNEMDESQRSQLIRLFVSSFASLFFSSVSSINRQSRCFCFRLVFFRPSILSRVRSFNNVGSLIFSRQHVHSFVSIPQFFLGSLFVVFISDISSLSTFIHSIVCKRSNKPCGSLFLGF